MRAPARLAAPTANTVAADALAPSAGVMPVTWNHAAPFITVSQSTASGGISLIAEFARSYKTVEARWLAPVSVK